MHSINYHHFSPFKFSYGLLVFLCCVFLLPIRSCWCFFVYFWFAYMFCFAISRYNLSVVGRFLDIDHLTSMCVQLPKQETVKTAESKITTVIYLKHTLELVEPLRLALNDTEAELFKAYHEVNLAQSLLLLLQKRLQKLSRHSRRMPVIVRSP